MRDAVVGATETRMDIGKDLAWSAEHDEPRVRQRGLTSFLARVLERRFCDRLGQVSRPILLLSVILLDFVIVAASGLGALLATGEMPPVGVVDVMAIALVAVALLLTLPLPLTVALLGPGGLRRMAHHSLQKAHYLESALSRLPGGRRARAANAPARHCRAGAWPARPARPVAANQ